MAEEKKSAPKKGPDIKKLMFLIVVLINVLGMGAGLALVYISTLGHHVEALNEEELLKDLREKKFADVDHPLLLTFEPFTVNLETPGFILNLQISAEVLDEDAFEELMRKTPQARDIIMRILHYKGFKDLESLQGKLFLKEEMVTSLNGTLNRGVVKDIFFSQFVVQTRR